MVMLFEGVAKSSLRGKHYALGISVTINRENTVEDQFRHIKEALVNWESSRGKSCDTLCITFAANEAEHAHILDFAQWAITNDEFMSALLPKLSNVLVIMADEDGQEKKRFKLGPTVA